MSAARTETRPSGLFIGRPLGIPVYLSPSVVLLAALVTAQIADHPELATRSGRVRLLVGLAAAVLLAASILLHELGHSVVALALGIPIRRITLFLFGGIAEISREPDSAAKEYLVSIAGPLVSLTLGCIGLVGLGLTTGPESAVLFGYIAFINLVLGFFNLLPGLPLDGGRVLRAVVWQVRGDRLAATRAAARCGMVVAVLLGGVGVYAVVDGDASSVITLLIAYFIFSGARSSLAQTVVAGRLPSLDVRSLTRPALSVTADLPLAEALRRAAVDERRLLVVDATGAPSAVLSSHAVDAVPAERRPWVSVGSVSRRLVQGLVLDSRLEGEDILVALHRTPASEYLVVDDDGGVLGVLATRDVVRRLAPQP